jgi:hypothetical protein
MHAMVYIKTDALPVFRNGTCRQSEVNKPIHQDEDEVTPRKCCKSQKNRETGSCRMRWRKYEGYY